MPEFFGEQIRLADEPSEWAMMEFAETAGDSEANELQQLASIMRLLESAIHPEDWQRFRSLARKNRARIERDLMPLVMDVFTEATDRPSGRPSVSSDGPVATVPSSMAGSSSRGTDPYDRKIGELNGKGRRDLALFLVDAREQRTA